MKDEHFGADKLSFKKAFNEKVEKFDNISKFSFKQENL